MKTELLRALILCETDIDGALKRFYGNEELYIKLLKEFSEEPTMEKLNQTIQRQDWKEAFIAAHALKGLAGNLGFVPLFHSLGELVVLLRAEKSSEIPMVHERICHCYREISTAINQCG